MYKIIITLFIAICIVGCSSNKEKKAERGSEQSLYEDAQKYLAGRQWDAARQSLELLEEYYPFGAYAEQSQLELIFTYFKTNNYDATSASADRFIRLHPQHRNVDYAYYMRGIASFNKDTSFRALMVGDPTKRDAGSAKDSFNYFSQLLNKFPNSPYGPDARKRMEYLRNSLARHEIHVANYYFKRGAFVAAAKRGQFVVENMQGTPAVPDGLAVMAQAYHLLEMQDQADQAAEVLYKNFPEHPSLDGENFIYQYKVKTGGSWVKFLTLGVFDKRQYVAFDSRSIFNPHHSNYPMMDVPTPPESKI